MKKLFLVLLFATTTSAQEIVNLTTPISKPSTNTYQVDRLVLDWSNSTVTVQLKSNNNELVSKTYDALTVPTGAALMIALNKANLTTRSLNQRIFDRLVLDGVVTGTVAGSVP